MGIFQRLFGRDPKQKTGDFFLEPDDAKTYGDIDYMRKPSVIKRTFAKTISGGGGETVKAISALEVRTLEDSDEVKEEKTTSFTAAINSLEAATVATPAPEAAAPAAPAASAPAPAAPAPAASKPAPAPAPTKSDNDLDFLSLARGIKRR